MFRWCFTGALTSLFPASVVRTSFRQQPWHLHHQNIIRNFVPWSVVWGIRPSFCAEEQQVREYYRTCEGNVTEKCHCRIIPASESPVGLAVIWSSKLQEFHPIQIHLSCLLLQQSGWWSWHVRACWAVKLWRTMTVQHKYLAVCWMTSLSQKEFPPEYLRQVRVTKSSSKILYLQAYPEITPRHCSYC